MFNSEVKIISIKFENNLKHIAPKKSLGQNFLIDRTVSKKIVDSLEIQNNELIIEIGPGTGALTEYILELISSTTNTKLIAIELDNRAVIELNQKFKSHIDNQSFKIINQDITIVNFNDLIEEVNSLVKSEEQTINKIKIVGNLPYYITGMILDLVLKNSNMFDRFVFMVQKEVADRILADKKSKDYSLLTLAVSLYGKASKVLNVKPGAFFPAPKVTSSVVKIEFGSDKLISDFTEIEKVMKLAKVAFNQRRKMLSNTLKQIIQDKKQMQISELIEKDDYFKKILTKRPEELDRNEFYELYKQIYQK